MRERPPPLVASALALAVLVRATLLVVSAQSPLPDLLTVGTWVSIGPAPLVYVDDPTSPEFFNSGRVAAIAADPGDARHWLVGAGNGGVWETRDAGQSFTAIADDAPTLVGWSTGLCRERTERRLRWDRRGRRRRDSPMSVSEFSNQVMAAGPGRSSARVSFARAAMKRVRGRSHDADVVFAASARGGYGRDTARGRAVPPASAFSNPQDGGATWTRTLAGQATGA